MATTRLTNKRIVITGGGGFLGAHLISELKKNGVNSKNIFIPRSNQYDLRRTEHIKKVVKNADIIIHLAAKVGGIGYNRDHPAEMFYDNIIMGVPLMHEAWKSGVEKFVAVGTICCYPKFTPVPFKEKDLWNGYPEETNAAYGLAKKMLLVQLQAYRKQYNFNSIYLLPVNLYGPGDDFDTRRSHVIPALIKKIDEAISKNMDYIEVWGTGIASREFLYVEDAVDAIIKAAELYDEEMPLNVGTGVETPIAELAESIKEISNYPGKIKWNTKGPDGALRKVSDISRITNKLKWKPKYDLKAGLTKTIKWFENNYESAIAKI